jgi:predicted Fe-Mo cluster-binding NifX family protein
MPIVQVRRILIRILITYIQKKQNVKTVITSTGNKVKSAFDLRFGRAGWFCLLDEESGEVTFHKNEFQDATQGAGTKVVEKVIELGAKKVISGDFGPKAKELLDRFQVQMVILPDNALTVDEIIKKIK